MKNIAVACTVSTLLLLISGTSEARSKGAPGDPLLELRESRNGVKLTRRRYLYDYQSAETLSKADPSTTRIVVTTSERMPDGQLYPVAEAVAESLRSRFPLTELRITGRTDLDGFLEMIRQNYDYMFVIGTNFDSHQYDSEQTIYSSRSTGVRCTPTLYGGGVNCNESSSTSVPVGSRPVKRSIFTDILSVTYGPAARATKAYSTDLETQISKWVVANSDDIGNTAVSFRYGTSDASWCDNRLGAQTFLAKMIGGNVVATKPDEFSITVAPKRIGCED